MTSRLGVRLVGAVVGSALLAGIAVGTVAMAQARATLRESISSSSLAAAGLVAAHTSSYVDEARNAVLLLASRADIRTAVERHDTAALAPELVSWAAHKPHHDGVFIFDTQGQLLADGTGRSTPSPTTASTRDWFQAVLMSHEPSLGEPTASRGTGRPVVPYGVPVFDAHGNLSGIIVAPISLNALSDMVRDVRIGEGARASIDDTTRGLVLADANEDNLLRAVDGLVPSALLTAAGNQMVLETSLPDGTPVLAASAPVPDLGWAVRVYEPTSSAYAPLNEMIARSVALIAVVLMIAGAFAFLLAMWITGPLERLRGAAKAMAEGDLGRRAGISRNDEIGELAEAFDGMADRLTSMVHTLEDDVRERQRIEAELRDGQDRLRAFLDAAPIGINILDATARTIQANRALQDMIGYTEAELLGRTFRDYSHPDEAGRDAVALREMRAGGTDDIVRREKMYMHRDGHPVWVHITAATPRDEQGRPRFFVAMVENLTDKKNAEAALVESEQRNRAVLTAALDGIVTIDEHRRIIAVNPAAQMMFDRSEHDLLTRTIDEVIALEAPASWSTPAALVGQRVEATGLRNRGDSLPVELAVAEHHLHDHREYTVYVRDITVRREADEERRQAEERLTRQAMHDALTGLPNRTLLNDRLQQAITAARRSGEAVGLLLLDLDRFKDVNDTLGHHAGDELLQQVAARLRGLVRASDTVGRLGGDEFAIVLPGVVDPVAVAAKVLTALEAPLAIEGHSVAVGASIGVTVFPEHGDDAQSLLRRADVAMYTAKRSRVGFAVYAAEQDHTSLEHLTLRSELRDGIARDELVLHYQPKVSLASDDVVGVEALVRWQHPRLGLLAPDEFIPLAEQSGLIRPLTSWVLQTSLRQVHEWREAGRMVVPVAVNLSAESLQEADLADEIARLLEQSGVEPELLEVEITESAYMARPQAAIATLERLRAMGIRVAIDDFGTGYSSLSYLMHLPVDELKIDRSFVRGMVESSRHAAIVRSILELGQSLGLRVVAEGLEDEQTFRRLTGMGCDAAQGYFLGRPAAAEVTAERLQPSPPVRTAA